LPGSDRVAAGVLSPAAIPAPPASSQSTTAPAGSFAQFVRGHEIEFGVAVAMAIGTLLPWGSVDPDFENFVGVKATWWDTTLWGLARDDVTGDQPYAVLLLAIGYFLCSRADKFRGALACAVIAFGLEIWTLIDVMNFDDEGILSVAWGAIVTLLITFVAGLIAYNEVRPPKALPRADVGS
jgi:hypothetical protein